MDKADTQQHSSDDEELCGDSQILKCVAEVAEAVAVMHSCGSGSGCSHGGSGNIEVANEQEAH